MIHSFYLVFIIKLIILPIVLIKCQKYHIVHRGPCLNKTKDFCHSQVHNSFCSPKTNECFCINGFVSIKEFNKIVCKSLLTDIICRGDHHCTHVKDSICHPAAMRCTCPAETIYVPELHSCMTKYIGQLSILCDKCKRLGGKCYLNKSDSEFAHCLCPNNRVNVHPHNDFSQFRLICSGLSVDIGQYCDDKRLVCKSKIAVCKNHNNLPLKTCQCPTTHIAIYQEQLQYFECFLKAEHDESNACKVCRMKEGQCYIRGGYGNRYGCKCSNLVTNIFAKMSNKKENIPSKSCLSEFVTVSCWFNSIRICFQYKSEKVESELKIGNSLSFISQPNHQSLNISSQCTLKYNGMVDNVATFCTNIRIDYKKELPCGMSSIKYSLSMNKLIYMDRIAFCTVLFHEFRLGHTVTEIVENVNKASGNGTAARRTLQRWFYKFRNRNESQEDKDGSLFQGMFNFWHNKFNRDITRDLTINFSCKSQRNQYKEMPGNIVDKSHNLNPTTHPSNSRLVRFHVKNLFGETVNLIRKDDVIQLYIELDKKQNEFQSINVEKCSLEAETSLPQSNSSKSNLMISTPQECLNRKQDSVFPKLSWNKEAFFSPKILKSEFFTLQILNITENSKVRIMCAYSICPGIFSPCIDANSCGKENKLISESHNGLMNNNLSKNIHLIINVVELDYVSDSVNHLSTPKTKKKNFCYESICLTDTHMWIISFFCLNCIILLIFFIICLWRKVQNPPNFYYNNNNPDVLLQNPILISNKNIDLPNVMNTSYQEFHRNYKNVSTIIDDNSKPSYVSNSLNNVLFYNSLTEKEHCDILDADKIELVTPTTKCSQTCASDSECKLYLNYHILGTNNSSPGNLICRCQENERL